MNKFSTLPEERPAIQIPLLLFFLCFQLLLSLPVQAAVSDPLIFSDEMLEDELIYPDWFKDHFGHLGDALNEARKAGKQGIIVYYGQKRCAYCRQFLLLDLGQPDIEKYIRDNFDVFPVDIWGIEDITDTDGTVYSERELAEHYKTTFTPSLVFYDLNGKTIFGLRGFYPPYKFKAALEYIVEGFYKKEKFRDYLLRADSALVFSEGELTERDFFASPPFNLDKARLLRRETVLFFEQGNCHACNLLHSGPLNKTETVVEIEQMHAIQLDMTSDQPITFFDGKKTTAKQLAEKLGVFHVPTLIFFDPDGKEIIRIDSIVQFYRLQGVLDYVNRQGYTVEPDYQMWRLKQRKTE
ncbi:MAG: thioredoxin fold domain-containing protein [Gammaproteobacteria bacterium]